MCHNAVRLSKKLGGSEPGVVADFLLHFLRAFQRLVLVPTDIELLYPAFDSVPVFVAERVTRGPADSMCHNFERLSECPHRPVIGDRVAAVLPDYVPKVGLVTVDAFIPVDTGGVQLFTKPTLRYRHRGDIEPDNVAETCRVILVSVFGRSLPVYVPADDRCAKQRERHT